MNKHLKKLRPLLLIMALFMLVNCQEDYISDDGHDHEHTNSNVVRKPFSEFKDLPDLMKTTLRRGTQKSRDSLDIYDFKIDSTEVMQVTTDHGRFYTMGITRNYEYPVEMFENLLVCDYGTTQEAFIISYKPDPEFYISALNDPYPKFKGGIGITRIDYNALQKTVVTNCVTINVLVCALQDTPHQPDQSCQLYYKEVTTCRTWIFDNPIFTGLDDNYFQLTSIGKVNGGGSGEGDTGSTGTGENTSPHGDEPSVNGPLTPGISGPVTGPVIPNNNNSSHEKNCEDLKKKSQDPNFEAKMIDLTNKAAIQNFESAYTMYQNASSGLVFSNEATGSAAVPEVTLNLSQSQTETSLNCIGFMHCHLDNGSTFSIFSFSDLIALASVANASTRPKSEMGVFLTSGSGTFALKVTDIMVLKNNLLRMQLAQNNYEIDFATYVDKAQSLDNQILGFLKFLNEKFADTGSGISLYKQDGSGDWENLTLSSSKKQINRKKC